MAFRHLEAGIKFLFVVLSLSCLCFEALVYEVVAIHYRFQERQDVSRVCLDECISRALELAHELHRATKGVKRIPFYYTKPVSLKPVRKVICLNEFASSPSIAHHPRLSPVSPACIFDSQLSAS